MFKPIDFTKEKEFILNSFKQIKKGDTTNKVDPVKVRVALENLNTEINRIFDGKTDLMAYTPQRANLPVTSVFARLTEKSPVTDFKLFLELAGSDFSLTVRQKFEEILGGCWDE